MKQKQTKKEQQQNPQHSTNISTNEIFNQSIEKYFKNVSVNTASYLQSVSDLQQEIINSRKKNAESFILLQKIIAEKTKFNTKISDESLKIVNDFAKQTNQTWDLQNQLMLKSIDALSKNIQAFNENADTQLEMNKKLIESWASIIKERKNH
ncbi:MAG: hypothetical protein ACE5RI_04730 [Candidatus Nitrosomaritimum yanchengensis]